MKKRDFGCCLIEGCAEVFGEVFFYLVFGIIGIGVLVLWGIAPDNFDDDLLVSIGAIAFAAIVLVICLGVVVFKRKRRVNPIALPDEAQHVKIPKYEHTEAAITSHKFKGVWISDGVLAQREPRNVFHRQLEKIDLPADEQANSHVLFRRKFTIDKELRNATVYITADDYYKLYINGQFVCQGPSPSYHLNYNYNAVDVTGYLHEGENLVAVHTYYQGLINRVWQSGDYRHGLLMDIAVNGNVVLSSDESFLSHRHTAYSVCGKSGYDTQFMERYDSGADEVGFQNPDFDDSAWENASVRLHVDYKLKPQSTKMLEFERIVPKVLERSDGRIFVDFGKMYVGYLYARACGRDGEKITLRYGQELYDDGRVRAELRCNCNYTEEWVLSGKSDELDQFDYKAFRYAELICGEDVDIGEICLIARHYPFELVATLKDEYASDESLRAIWDLCVHTLKYGVQETIQDCPDREKGFYLGDGCYDAFAHYILTEDDSMVRKLIDDAFESSFICDGLVTCMSCSFMQEIAEYPLILPDLMLWHYNATKDSDYLSANIKKMKRVLDFYKNRYEKDGILRDIDRWCVVEWPKNYQDGYAMDILEGKVCHEAHISINAYYYRAITVLNKLCELVGSLPYRNTKEIYSAIVEKFYDSESHLFVDGEEHRHISLAGNAFAYVFDFAPDGEFENTFLTMLREKGEDKTSFFTTFPLLMKFAREGNEAQIKRYLCHDGTWKRMLSEDATSTFEGWGKDCKWNTSLFHLTMSSVVMFMADVDLKGMLEYKK